MMNKQNEVKTVYKNSFPIFGLAFLIMLTLKLLGKTAISWWIVTAPLWGPLAIFLAIVLFTIIIAIIVGLISG